MTVNPIRTAGASLRQIRILLSSTLSPADPVSCETRKTGDGVDVFIFDAGAGSKKFREIYFRVRSVLAGWTYGVGEETLCDTVAGLLIEKRKSVAIAESLTGGLISDRLTDIPGSSRFFKLSVVVYSDESKVKLLCVPEKTMKRWGAVSRQTCRKMLEGLSGLGEFHYRIAVTGIAGPLGGSSTKPVGTVFAGIAGEKVITIRKLKLIGTRREIKEATVNAVLLLLWREIAGQVVRLGA